MNEQDKVSLDEIRRAWTEAMDAIEQDSERYWNSLTKEQQLDAFCAVCRRIYKGDVVDKGTYRYVLYNVFGFGPEAYAQAQLAGYLTIHNSIFDADHDDRLLQQFVKFCGLDQAKISEFWQQNL